MLKVCANFPSKEPLKVLELGATDLFLFKFAFCTDPNIELVMDSGIIPSVVFMADKMEEPY